MANSPTIIVTRPSPMGEKLCQELNEHGYRAIHCPLIRFTANTDYKPEQKFALLKQHKLWIFVSKQAVDFSLKDLSKEQLDQFLGHTLIAVGKATQKALQPYGLSALVPKTPDSEGILALINQFSLPADYPILLIRGDKGRGLLEQELSGPYQLGVLPVYHRIELTAALPPAVQQSSADKPIGWVVTSGQLLELTDKMLSTAGIKPEQVAIIGGSARISDLARQKGYTNCYTAKDASNVEIIRACQEWQKA
ncbi:uroporphyrinogen-III synthase [Kangiella aquimarina]|uniref:Uroporphyrinogen-III synthase n=1 Tax=Kangiella aquimarina TaxID=261965 RepID=A0ABZ0X4K7_9GAMM|nr:uroporphyrinogen-III synthase [Kangiella aquimarina]WQG85523.1 uroporphyrinogen-III synthase [Kangiella aquimarina]